MPAIFLAASSWWWAAAASPVFVLNSLDASVSVIDPVGWKEIKRLFGHA